MRREPVATVVAPDLERAAIEEVGIGVAAVAVLSARLDAPAGDVGKDDVGEHRVARRRVAEEVGALLQIPAVVELELVAHAGDRGAERESPVERELLLPAVEVLESRAAVDVLVLVAHAHVAAGFQAATRRRLEHPGALEEVAAEVGRIVEDADARLPAARDGFPGGAEPHAALVELMKVPVLAQDEAGARVDAARCVPPETIARR